MEDTRELGACVNMDKKKRLTVIVCGFCGTGKSVIARKIEEALLKAKVDVDRIPDDDENMGWTEEDIQKKVDSLIDSDLEVVVKCVQLRRPTLSTDSAKRIHDDMAAMDYLDIPEES